MLLLLPSWGMFSSLDYIRFPEKWFFVSSIPVAAFPGLLHVLMSLLVFHVLRPLDTSEYIRSTYTHGCIQIYKAAAHHVVHDVLVLFVYWLDQLVLFSIHGWRVVLSRNRIVWFIRVWSTLLCNLGLHYGKVCCRSDTRGQNDGIVLDDSTGSVCMQGKMFVCVLNSINKSQGLLQHCDRRSYVFGRLSERYKLSWAISSCSPLYLSLFIGMKFFWLYSRLPVCCAELIALDYVIDYIGFLSFDPQIPFFILLVFKPWFT